MEKIHLTIERFKIEIIGLVMENVEGFYSFPKHATRGRESHSKGCLPTRSTNLPICNQNPVKTSSEPFVTSSANASMVTCTLACIFFVFTSNLFCWLTF